MNSEFFEVIINKIPQSHISLDTIRKADKQPAIQVYTKKGENDLEIAILFLIIITVPVLVIQIIWLPFALMLKLLNPKVKLFEPIGWLAALSNAILGTENKYSRKTNFYIWLWTAVIMDLIAICLLIFGLARLSDAGVVFIYFSGLICVLSISFYNVAFFAYKKWKIEESLKKPAQNKESTENDSSI